MISSYSILSGRIFFVKIHKFSEDLSIAIQIDNLSTIIHNNFYINNLQLILKNILVGKQIKFCHAPCVRQNQIRCDINKCLHVSFLRHYETLLFSFCMECCLNSLVLGRNAKTTEIKGNLFWRKCGIYIKKISYVTYVSRGISGTLNWY